MTLLANAYLFQILAQQAEPDNWFELPIFLVVSLFGVLIGVIIGRFFFVRREWNLKSERDELRRSFDQATTEHTKLISERDEAQTHLQTRTSEQSMLAEQLRSTQRQLDQAREGWRNAEKQIADLGGVLQDFRSQSDSLRNHLSDLERTAGEKHTAVVTLTTQLDEARAHLSETQRVAVDRQSNLAYANMLLSRHRDRFSAINYLAAEIETDMKTITQHINSMRQRLAELEADEENTPALPLPTTPKATVPPVAPSVPPTAMPEPVAPSQTDSSLNDSFIQSDVVPARAKSRANAPVISDLSNLTQEFARVTSKFGGTKRGEQPSEPSPAINENAAYDSANSNLDRLQAIRGVGRIYAMRLTERGIRSVEDLAVSTPDQLDKLMDAPRWRKPDYANWIEQAKSMTDAVPA